MNDPSKEDESTVRPLCAACGRNTPEDRIDLRDERWHDRGRRFGEWRDDDAFWTQVFGRLCASCIYLALDRRESGRDIGQNTVTASLTIGMCPFCGRFRDCRCSTWLPHDRLVEELRARITGLEADLQLLRGGKIYVLRSVDDTLIAKIGFSVQPERRALDWAQTTGHAMEIIGCTPGDRVTESQLHQRFRHDRIFGCVWGTEFFRYSAELQQYIEKHFEQSESVGFIARPTHSKGSSG